MSSQPHEISALHARLVQSMLDASMHGIILVEPYQSDDGSIKDFIVRASNAAVESQVGFKIEPTHNLLLSQVFPVYRETGFFDLYLKAWTTGQVQRQELFYKDAHVEGWFDIGAAPSDNAIVITFVNITEAKTNQRKIERTAFELQTFLDIAQSGIFLFHPVIDESGEIVDFKFAVVNRSLASYVGQEPHVLINELGSKWFPGYKTNGLFDLYKETCVTGKTNRFDFHYDDDEIDVWLDIMSTKFEDGVLVTFTDYTPVKKLQLQLEASINELKRSNENLEEFAYASSHDLQEPLRKIHFFANRLKETYETALGREGKMMLERMEVATERMRSLIDDLLAYSKVTTKRRRFENVDTHKLVEEVMTDLEASIKEKEGLISLHNLPVVSGDKLQLQQMFQNLISNALKYNLPDTPPRIIIRSSMIKGKEINLPVQVSEHAQDFHLIEIIDNGLGFEQQNARKIFQIFQRLHGRSEYPGTGVGLAIVQKVIDNHGGYVQAKAEPLQGATFQVILPVAKRVPVDTIN
ncbi:MAG TPA: ATP-binding protein [Chitinophagaceae bacterium]|jgi:signal transduction histidine kinase|nr:ATP-binding protein [Chitinophagaceae bacterium]